MKKKIRHIIPNLIIITALLHYVGVAAYVYDLIPKEYQRIFFYNLDRIYLITTLALLYTQNKRPVSLVESSKTNLSILGAGIQMIGYLIAVNAKYLIKGYEELTWICLFGFIFIVSLITLNYVSRK